MLRQLTVRRLMAAVALLGVALGAFRAHLSLGSFVAGMLSIAWIETGRWVGRREAAGLAAGAIATVGAFIRSMGVAAAVIVGSMVPVVIMSPLLSPRSGCQVNFPEEVLFVTVPLCIYATIRTARALMRWLGPDRTTTKPAPEPFEGTVGAGGAADVDDR